MSYKVSHCLDFASPCYNLTSSLVLYIICKLVSRGLIKSRCFFFFFSWPLYRCWCVVLSLRGSQCLDGSLFVLLAATELPFHSYLSGPLSIFAFIDYSLFKICFAFCDITFLVCLLPLTIPQFNLLPFSTMLISNVGIPQGRDPLLLHCTLFLLDFIHCPTLEYYIYALNFCISPDIFSLNLSP